MSDSGFTGGLTPTSLLQSGRNVRGDNTPATSVEIIKASEEVRSSRSNDPLKGQVERREQNGDLRIKTDKGEIVVRPPPESTLKEGDIIEIKIPPNASSNTAQIKQKPLPPPTQPAQPQSQGGVQDYINLDFLKNQQPLTTNEPLQLIPLTPAQIKTIVSLPVVTLPPVTLQIPPVSVTGVAGEFQFTPLQHIPPLQSGFFDIPALPAEDNVFPFETKADVPLSDILPLRAVIAQVLKISPETLITSEILQTETPIYRSEQDAIISQIIPQESTVFPALNASADELPRFARAGEVEARLIGVTPEREFPVLRLMSSQNSEQIFFIPQHFKDIPEGSLLLVSPLSTSPENTAQHVAAQILAAPTLPPIPLPLVSSGMLPLWDTADEIYQTLLQQAPTLAQNMAAITPNTTSPARMASTALFFIAALRSGDIQSWIGDKAIDVLKRAGKSDLLSRFTREAADIGRSENAGQEWRNTAFPMVHGENIHRVLLHYRKEQQHRDDPQGQGGGTTRFIMDLSLSKIGKLQLDGLFQGNEAKGIGRLDLIVRTQSPFSPAMQSDMRKLYKSTLDETAYTGELLFQDSSVNWVYFHAETQAQFKKEV